MKNKNKSWSEVVEMTLAEMSITFWFVEQCKGDTMFHAECFLDECRKRTTVPLFKVPLDRVRRALELVAYGSVVEWDELPDKEQVEIEVAATWLRNAVTDAPVHAVVN
jgi:hypothetical protein